MAPPVPATVRLAVLPEDVPGWRVRITLAGCLGRSLVGHHLPAILGAYGEEAADVAMPPRIHRALASLLEEINNTPPHMPGDPRPITYQLTDT